MYLSSITIFTDGSSRGNPGPGGFGAIIVSEGRVSELGGREGHTTNNRMELQAAISALSYVSTLQLKTLNLKLFTDSSYLVNGITKWVYSWERRNWVTMDKKPVLNKDLWEKLLAITIYRNCEWRLVSGHVGVAGNVRCDEIATAFAGGLSPQLYSGLLASYPVENVLDISHDATAAQEKSANRAHSSAKAYSYVSLVGGVVQTHKTWPECEARVKGKSAKYKKVLSADEEKKLIGEWSRS